MQGLQRVIRFVFLLALVPGTAVLLSGYGANGSVEAACSTAPGGPLLELVYRLDTGKEKVTPGARNEVMEIVCKRLQTIGGTEGEVRALADRRIRVLLPQLGNAGSSQRVVEQIGAAGQVNFYDWEPNLIGRERRIGGHPGEEPPAGALSRANREWRAAGRNVNRPANLGLILAGAFPTAYGAVNLASELTPREHCAACSASTSRFYMFDRTARHLLIAGPVTTRTDLRTSAVGERRRHDGIVLKVPAGVVIVSEQLPDGIGRSLTATAPGWYAIRDRPALSGADIAHPEQAFGEFNEPIVIFGFTDSGRRAFHDVTRHIARRGMSRTDSLGAQLPEQSSGHFAIVFDGEVETRPIINYAENPDGIDGRTGAQISGGFVDVQEAQDLATILKIGALPINLTLIRQEDASPPE